MPATAGRVRMPANNRVHSSAALQTHGIWQSAIGYDPYAPDQKQAPPTAPGGDRDAQISAPSSDQQNAYDSFQGLLALARLTGSNADEARGACRKCGRVGHLPFQCRNFLVLKDELAAASAAAAASNLGSYPDGGNGSSHRKDRAHSKHQGEGGMSASAVSDLSSEEDESSETDESGLSDSSEDSEMERAIAAKLGKNVLNSLSKKTKSAACKPIMYNASKRVSLLRFIKGPFFFNRRSYIKPLPCIFSRHSHPWSYNNQVPSIFSLPFVRQATSACSDEAVSQRLAENAEEIDDLAHRIALVLNKQPWCPLTESELQVFLPLSSSVVHAVLLEDIALEPALSFLSWACKQPDFVLQADDVSAIAQAWACKYAAFALPALQGTLNSVGSFYSEAAWAAMMTMSTFLRKPEQSVCIFMEAKKHGCKPSQLLYDPFLFALVRCQRVDAALLTTQEMLTSRILPGDKALGVLLDATCKAGKAKDAYNLVRDIAQLGSVQYREFAHSRLITAVWRINSSMALDVFNEMKVKGLQPDKQAYTVCLKLLCRNHRFDLAQSLLKDMSRQKCSPDMLTYTTLINGLYKGGKAAEALDVIELIRKEGHPIDCRMYTALLSCLFSVGRVQDAVEEFEKMQKDGRAADLVTYFVMIKNLCESGNVKRALGVKKVMNEKGFEPDARLYLALQRGLCVRSHNVDELLQLIEELKAKGYSPIAEVYFTLVTHFCTKGDKDMARAWVKEMVDAGHKPTPYIRMKFLELCDDVNK